MSALTASPPVCDIAERPHGRRRKKVLPLLVTMNRSNRQPGSTRAPAGSPPPVRHPSSGYAPPLPPNSRLRALPCAGLFPPPSRPLRSAAPALTFPSWDGPPFLSSPGSGLPLSVRHGPYATPFRLRQPVSSPPLHRRPGRHTVLFLFRPQRRKHFCRP